MTLSLSTLAANTQLAALADLLDGGFLRVYSGKRPQSSDEPLDGQQLLAEVRFSSPAFKRPKRGILRARTIEPDHHSAQDGDGKPTWYRAFAADGETAVLDGSVGMDDANDLVVSTQFIQKSAIFSIADFTLRPSGVVFNDD